jgi:hypothetical protein
MTQKHGGGEAESASTCTAISFVTDTYYKCFEHL